MSGSSRRVYFCQGAPRCCCHNLLLVGVTCILIAFLEVDIKGNNTRLGSKRTLFKVLILFPMPPNHKIAHKFKVSKIQHYILTTPSECIIHISRADVNSAFYYGYDALLTFAPRTRMHPQRE